MAVCNGQHSGCDITACESRPTSVWSFITREFDQPLKEEKQMTVQQSGTGASSDRAAHWHGIDWASCYREVRRLQARIVKAEQAGKHGRVKALQWLLTHSFSGRVLAVRPVTENKGQGLPGVHGIIWSTPKSRLESSIVAQTAWLPATSAQADIHPES